MGNEENMAFNQNIAQEYNRNKILTASPAELTLMLYEGAIKFCNICLLYTSYEYKSCRGNNTCYSHMAIV